ncbi:Dolichyl-diphosphooligosaccharide--protein glycosyltransferase subunit 4A [Quillaja saponaria]|uniref:Dolichyl-diphosphooligosaccharide--protein glycosyltransferase subunit 4A n=1 Tax=Quillaja saponaria TaxID=32244 RepID=A0AAD7VIF8_QUISA|nr:Dolichyl-diphosphooligosaccharide--protein glycosyltransferase subunit 4A [Quillaja saponaria]
MKSCTEYWLNTTIFYYNNEAAPTASRSNLHPLVHRLRRVQKSSRTKKTGNSQHKTMFDDQDLGFFANFLGIFIFVLVIAYHYVMADSKYE